MSISNLVAIFLIINVIIIGLLILLVKRNKKRNNSRQLLFFLIISLGGITGCEKENVNVTSDHSAFDALRTEFNLQRSSSVTKENAISFTNAQEARNFLVALKEHKFSDQSVINVLPKNVRDSLILSASRSSGVRRIDPCDYKRTNNRIGIMPWSWLSVTTTFDDDDRHIENVSSIYAGFTFPAKINQTGYQEEQVAYTSQGPITTFTVTYSATFYLVFENIGDVYTTEFSVRGYLRPCPGGGGSYVEYEEIN